MHSCSTQVLDGVAVIRLDDGQLNVITRPLLDALHSALDTAERSASAAAIIGRPGVLSAGFDLAVMTTAGEAREYLLRSGVDLWSRLLIGPIPIVLGATGHAIGAGALTLLAADVRIGADGPFKIGLNEVAIGMPLPGFLIELARYRMPPPALDSILWGATLRPPSAVSAGYLDHVVPAHELEGECVAAAKRLSGLGLAALQQSKWSLRGPVVRAMRAALDADLDRIRAREPRD